MSERETELKQHRVKRESNKHDNNKERKEICHTKQKFFGRVEMRRAQCCLKEKQHIINNLFWHFQLCLTRTSHSFCSALRWRCIHGGQRGILILLQKLEN